MAYEDYTDHSKEEPVVKTAVYRVVWDYNLFTPHTAASSVPVRRELYFATEALAHEFVASLHCAARLLEFPDCYLNVVTYHVPVWHVAEQPKPKEGTSI